ncbi:MAG: aspartate/glutamate racemase family protein, partial [Candidatus Nanoarchaeia archaeon]
VPYGNKSPANIAKFAVEDASFLFKKGVKLIIVACNTVASIAMDKLHAKFPDTHIIGVLEAGVNACLSKEPRSVAIIGTNATVKSDSYRRKIHATNPSIRVSSIACPLFVPIVEEGLQESEIAKLAIDFYLKDIKKSPPDILLLACTHYPLLNKNLLEYFRETKILILDSASACADYAKDFILNKGIAAQNDQQGSERYYVTDMPADFLREARRFLGRDLLHFEKVSLD